MNWSFKSCNNNNYIWYPKPVTTEKANQMNQLPLCRCHYSCPSSLFFKNIIFLHTTEQWIVLPIYRGCISYRQNDLCLKLLIITRKKKDSMPPQRLHMYMAHIYMSGTCSAKSCKAKCVCSAFQPAQHALFYRTWLRCSSLTLLSIPKLQKTLSFLKSGGLCGPLEKEEKIVN